MSFLSMYSASDENQPPITRKQQRLFALLTVLSKQERYLRFFWKYFISTFNYCILNIRYKNIIDRMIKLLWHNMFGRDRMYNLKLNAVQNCGRMFALCARWFISLINWLFRLITCYLFRFNDDINIARHFIYDLFYFKSPRNHILVCLENLSIK